MLRPAVEGALPPPHDAIAARGGDDAGNPAHQMLLDVLQEGIRGVATRCLEWVDGVDEISNCNLQQLGQRATTDALNVAKFKTFLNLCKKTSSEGYFVR